MKRTLMAIILLSLAIIIFGCSSNKKQEVKADGDLVYRPAWWGEQADQSFVFTYGQGTNLNENVSMNVARSNALSEAAQYVQINVQNLLKNYVEEAGITDPQVLALSSNVVRAVTDAEFSGIITGKMETRKVKEAEGDRYKTWVQLKIPSEQINRKLAAQIRNEEALYNQFKASQAFQELDELLDKE
ncbi:MAG: hypothetical protein PHY41_02800 [Candidatus Cloacimonetes bacterium]|nr:hypothetical protein [Candidatus Cloacimonadota bacterium]MDY0298989.1 hypothetical protein [Candidatus Cloacimonadaceae bacterium]MCB5278603.1 hypothetical protein [Candidatus Cloacimonadota bacterium]MCK9331993.1 hypothetical protein [Candidatus Cloacimonadota bacterium]MDD2210354.1 hypothetical protein [Candidatus Cloacimonadota bacterium]